MNKNALDRLRIVRNAIVREWQKLDAVRDELPENASTKDLLLREMSGLRTALQELHNEFDELEPMSMNQKPRCPFCQVEMEQKELAEHMLEHSKKGDTIRGIRVEGLDPGFKEQEMRQACREYFGPCSPAMTRVTREEHRPPKAGGPGGAAHPDKESDPEEKP